MAWVSTLVESVKNWDCEDINDLIDILQHIDEAINDPGTAFETRLEDVIDISSLPIAPEYEARVDVISAYPVWTCDKRGRCLVDLSYYDVRDIEEIESVET